MIDDWPRACCRRKHFQQWFIDRPSLLISVVRLQRRKPHTCRLSTQCLTGENVKTDFKTSDSFPPLLVRWIRTKFGDSNSTTSGLCGCLMCTFQSQTLSLVSSLFWGTHCSMLGLSGGESMSRLSEAISMWQTDGRTNRQTPFDSKHCVVARIARVKRRGLTLWRPLLPHGYSYKTSCHARPG